MSTMDGASKAIVGTDFGFGNDVSVEHVMTKDKDGKITVVSSKIIGKAKDFDSEDKRNNYFNTKIKKKNTWKKILNRKK